MNHSYIILSDFLDRAELVGKSLLQGIDRCCGKCLVKLSNMTVTELMINVK